MRQFTTEQLQERFEKLSPELREAITSANINDTIKKIGEKHGLHIDQIGELVDAVGLVMLDLVPAKDFVRTFSHESGVADTDAQSIADDINKEIFDNIKSAMRSVEKEIGADQETRDNISSVERAGGFEIEKAPTGNGGADKASEEAAAMTETDKINLLSDIESPPPVGSVGGNVLPPKTDEIRSEPLVDQLLKGPVAVPEEKITKKPLPKTNVKPPNNLPTDDPYREPVQ